MSEKLRPPAKCGNGQRHCVTDVQYANELAFSDALQALGRSKPAAARRLGVALNTVRSWSDGRTTPDICVIIACPEFASVWQAAFTSRLDQVIGARAA